MALNFPPCAAGASWSAALYGVPFGGCAGWLMVVICVDDSGEFGFGSNLLAAALGWPVALLCDALLLPVALLRALWREPPPPPPPLAEQQQ